MNVSVCIGMEVGMCVGVGVVVGIGLGIDFNIIAVNIYVDVVRCKIL